MSVSCLPRIGAGGLLRILVAGFALLASTWVTQARVVGIVFDDSGSMIPRVHLPTFGVQLLVSTLDGRPGIDRLLTLRLSEGPALSRTGPGTPLSEQPIRDARQVQGTIDRIRTVWPVIKDGTGTPYAAIDVMLRGIVATLKPGEPGFLVVVSDGGFGDPPDPAALRRAFETYKAELDRKEATLQVAFLLIAFPDRNEVEAMVEQQKVRSTLLEVFNGASPGAGARRGQHDVTDIKDLMKALKTVIADVSGTAESLSDTYVRTAGAVRTIDSPLAISRIVTLATAPDRQTLAHLRDTSFQGAERVVYASRMDRADTSAANLIEVGETTQLVFAPRRLYAGTHSLTFDRPIGDDVMMVFQTAATVVLEVLTEAGTRVAPDGQGRRILTKGARYKLAATLVDETPQGPAPVPLTSLRGQTTFEASLDKGGTRRLPMTIDPAANQAIVDFPADWLGEGSARSEVRLEGFVTSPSQPVKLVVVDGATTFETAVRGLEPCPGCPSGTIGATFDATGRPVDMADVTLTPRGSLGGTARLDRAGLPSWIEIIDGSGHVLTDGAAVPIAPGTEVRFKLRRSGTLPVDVPDATVPFAFALKTDAPLSGDGRVEGSVRISAAPATLRFREHHGPDDGTGRLVASGSALRDAALDLVFTLEGAVTSNGLQNFTAHYDGRLVDVAVAELTGGQVVLRPQVAWWCTCFLWFERGTHRVRLDYRGPGNLQSAAAETEVVIAPTLREILTGCAQLLGLILLLGWLLGAVIVTGRTARFPKGSVAEIQEGTQLPRHEDLRRLNLTFLKALLWPVRRLWAKSIVPHERRRVDGLAVVARRGGYLLRLDREMSLEVRGQDLQEMLAINPRLADLRMNWREEITLHGPPPTRIRFLRSLSEAAI